MGYCIAGQYQEVAESEHYRGLFR